MVVDVTNDGQRSSTDPVMTLDPATGRVSGKLHTRDVLRAFLIL